MKKVNVTFSIPVETNDLLHALVTRKKLSAFVSVALHKALEEKAHLLKKAYIEAEKDSHRTAIVDDWKNLDIEGWE